MQITFLGTGTSQGVPVIGCDCEVCASSDPRDKRLRTAVKISIGHKNWVIDAGPDFRYQMLRSGTHSLEAILITHEHNDHVNGLDDVRPFNFAQQRDMPIYCSRHVATELQKRFAYAFDDNPYPGAPRFNIIHVEPFEEIQLTNEHHAQVIPYWHGELPILGYRIGGFAYLTDIKTIDQQAVDALAGLDCLVLSALHHEPHPSHANLEEALHIASRISPRRTFLTHMSHRMGLHRALVPGLPPHVFAAFDGLTVEVA